MSKKKNWNAADAAGRAQATNPIPAGAGQAAAPTLPPARGLRVQPGRPGEYVLVSVWSIDPAPWQSRLAFNGIEGLADSIRGDGVTEGVGIVEPLLVRCKADGRFGLIDGERRWRAAKIVAHEQADGDYLVPVRIFDVSDRIAQLIGQAANDQRDQPKALEMALTYVRLRQVMEEEAGGAVVGARKVAGIGWHGSTMANQYLAVAESVTPDVMRDAGIVDAQGHVPEALVTGLKIGPLHKIAMLESREERVTALRALADRVRGIKPATPKPSQATQVESTRAERIAQARDGEGIAIRVKGPVRTLAPDVAWRIAADQMAPAMLALVEHGGAGGEGYLTAFESDHTVLVVPREVEQLSIDQLLRLTEEVSALAKRVSRAARFRKRGVRTA